MGLQQPYRKQTEINHEDKFKIKKLLKNEIEKKKEKNERKWRDKIKEEQEKKNCQLSSQFHYLFIETVKLTPVGLNFLLIFIWF